MERVMKKELIEQYRKRLILDEKGPATIEKYLRDLEKFAGYAGDRELDKELVIAYKHELGQKNYEISSINSFLAAVNRFFGYMGWNDLKVKLIKVQKTAFCPEKKCLSSQDYQHLVKTAAKEGKRRLAVILQTIASTGVRISELAFITAESIAKGMAEIHNKGKVRTILYPKELQKLLEQYAKERQITEGILFRTSGGKPVDRSNLWREMKALCREARVDEEKVFPHNLRHLFARSFYHIEKDIAMLADILGHNSIDTTRIYVRISGREHQKRLDRMGMVLLTSQAAGCRTKG